MTTHQLPSALRSRNIELTTDILAFWDFCADFMDDDTDKEACRAIGKDLKKTYFALFVEGMLSLTHGDMEKSVVSCGGKKTWLKQIETLLGHTFRPASQVPVSALTQITNTASTGGRQYMASITSSQARGQENSAHKAPVLTKHEVYGAAHRLPKENLGKYLERVNELDNVRVTKKEILELCDETIDPEHNTLTPNDTKSITNFIFWKILDEFHDVGGSVNLFRHLAKQLYKIVPKPFYPAAKWAQKLEMRFEAGRRKDASVRCRSLPPLSISRPRAALDLAPSRLLSRYLSTRCSRRLFRSVCRKPMLPPC